jgi:flagellar biosynthesis protein FliP
MMLRNTWLAVPALVARLPVWRVPCMLLVLLATGSAAAEPAPRELPAVPLEARAERQAEADVAGNRRLQPVTLFDWRVVGLLAVVAGGLLAVRRYATPRVAALPPDVFEVLGTGSLGGPHPVRVVRFGPKTLLVSVSAGGCHTLSEITDAEATECIARACRGQHPPLRPAGRAAAAAVLMSLALFAAHPAHADEPPAAANEPAVVAVEPAAVTPAVAADDGAVAPATLPTSPGSGAEAVGGLVRSLVGTRSLDATLSAALMFGVVSLAPAVLLMTTCFVRMSVVLSLVRQGLGTAQLPSNQIVTSLALFLSAMVMWPVWTTAYRAGVEPYQAGTITLSQAYEQGSLPIRRWMANQIEQAGNRDTMLLFLERHPDAPRQPATYDEVPLETLLPAFLVSELETAFTIGFRMLLPFLVLDVLVATLVVSTGLVMLPPTLVSLPLKLLVFVMADGWSLVVKSLLDSVW